jgi:hypothetical protein
MAGRTIDDLPPPAVEYRLSLLFEDFESWLQATAEDRLRADKARKLAAQRGPKRAARLLRLADRLDPKITPDAPKTMAASRFMRDFRERLIGATWKLVAEDQTGRVVRYDIAKPSWALSPAEFRKCHPRRICAKLRADLLRAARKLGFKSVADCDGFVLAFVHGEHTQFDDGVEYVHLHFHAIATGDWVDIVEEMRGQRGYRPTDRVRSPIRASRKLTDLPRTLSYLVKGYWPGKWCGLVDGVGRQRRTRDHRRIPEPHHSDILVWLDECDPSDMVLKMGVKQNKYGFVLCKVKST